jgi:parallel beta-helix repeat protein
VSYALVRKGGVWTRPSYTPVDPGSGYTYVVNPGDNPQTVLNTAPAGASILFKPGTHRPDSLAPKTGQVLVGQTGTIWDGGTTLTSWTSDGSGHWYATATLPSYTESTSVQCELSDTNPCRKREQVWSDSVHLTRVMALTDLVDATGFYQDYAAGRVYLGFDPAGHTIVMASKTYAINSNAANIRITGIKVQHYAPPSQLGTISLQGSGVEVDHCEITDTHAIGIFLDGATNGYVHDNHVHHCGQLGIGVHASDGARVAVNHLHNNNTDGYRPDDWESGDIKFTNSSSVTVEDNYCHDSRGLGIWGDIENGATGKVYIRGNRVENCYADGIRYEISYDCEISGNTITGCGFQFAADHAPEGASFTGYSGFGTAGININTSRDVEVTGNTLGPNQNGIFAQFRPRADSTHPNRDLVNLYVHDNDVTMTPVTLTGKTGNLYTSGNQFGEGVSGLGTLMGSSGIDPTQYFDSRKNNRFDANTYRVAATTRAQYAWNSGYRTWDNWRSAGQEATGQQLVAPRPGWQVTAGSSDQNWHNTNAGFWSQTGTKIFLGDNAAVTDDADRGGVFLFAPSMPGGAVVAAGARLYLYATGLSGTVIPKLRISAEKTIAATVPTSKTNLVTSHLANLTTAKVDWQPTTWPNGTWQASPDISAILQELASLPGWTPSSPVLLFVETSPDQAGNTTGQISCNAYETDPALSANLQAAWS